MFKNVFGFVMTYVIFAVFALSQNSYAQLSDSYTIPGTPFATISAAVDSLNQVGVGTGGVIFNVSAGYTEDITEPILLSATGTATNQIIFQKSGTGINPLVTRTDAGTISTTTLGGQGDAVIITEGSDYVTFDAIDISTNDNGIEYGYFLRKVNGDNGCKYIAIKNCVVDMTKGNSAYVIGIYSSNLIAASLPSSATGITVTSIGGRNESITITGNTVQDVHAAIVLRGYNHTSAPYSYYDQNFVVGTSGAGNIIQNYAGGNSSEAYAIYLIYHNNPDISYNTINNTAGGGSDFTGPGYGIFFSTGRASSGTYNNNNINLSATTGQLRGIMFGTTGISSHICNNNTITLSQAGTNAADCIYATGLSAGSTLNINNNSFSYGTFASNTSSYMIYASNGANDITVTGNQSNGTINKTGTGVLSGYYNFGSPNGGTANISNNNFSNIITTHAFIGIDHRTAYAQTHVIANNIISNITASSIATGIKQGYGAVGSTVNGNNIYGFSGGIMEGILLGVDAAPSGLTVFNNKIYNLSSTDYYIRGITNFLGVANRIYNNEIYDLQVSNVEGSVYGVRVTGGTKTYIYNNFISDLRTPITSHTDAIRAINITSTTPNSSIGLYYNSIYLDASSSGANFGTAGVFHTYSATATTAVLDMRNNVIVNNSTSAGTGLTVAFRRSAATSLANYGSESNNNVFYAGSPSATRLIFYDGTNAIQTLSEYKTFVSPRDAASFTENPNFINSTIPPFDLHINPAIATQLESGGTPVTTPIEVLVDFDGDTRNSSTPDVGADEFTGVGLDLAPPVIIYTPLLNTSSTSNRTLVANIADEGSGVPTTGTGLPVLYWKINTSGTWTGVTSTYLTGDEYQFSFGGGVAAGDTIYYYVVAQDEAATPNVCSYPLAGAGGFTANPPAAAIPPTSPSSYLITNTSLAGDYTVGTAMFNMVTGKNIYFEKVVKKVLKEVDVEVPPEGTIYEKGKEPQTVDNLTSLQVITTKQLMEVEEISWIPMQNGKPYYGNLYVKRVESPEFDYPAGTEGIYATITAAIADLNIRGVDGAVNFLLTDALYTSGETYPIVININNAQSTTATNTVTIKPNTGVTALIQGASLASQIFRIEENYIIIDGSNSGGTDRSLTIENISTTVPQVIRVGSINPTALTNVSIKNCILINGATTFYSNALEVSANDGTAGYFNNITILNNNIQKARAGIYCLAVPTSGNGSGLVVSNNDLSTSGTNAIRKMGVYVQGADSTTVTNNTIANFSTLSETGGIYGIWYALATTNSVISNNNIGPITSTSTYLRGIQVTSDVTNANITIAGNTVTGIATSYSDIAYGILAYNTTGIIIEKNKVDDIVNTNANGYGARGIYANTGTIVTEGDITFRNNFVWNVRGTADANYTYWGIGIGYEGYTSSINVYNNSVNLYGSFNGYNASTIHAAFAVWYASVNTLDIRNNIFVNTFDNTNSTTDKSYAIYIMGYNTYFVDINHNDYYVSGPAGILGNLGGGLNNYTTLNDWQTATGKDANSLSVDPHFYSETDLHINAGLTPTPLESGGGFITGVDTDIDGDTRPGPAGSVNGGATAPDIGADEFDGVPVSQPTFPLSVLVINGWNMVSIPGLHPDNQNVETWWSGKDPNVQAYKFVSGYQQVTTTTPGEGYWIKHIGPSVYNYPAIQIVPNDPINGNINWNIIGGYQSSVPVGSLSTNPPGQISGIIYGWNDGYVTATNIVPGYAYWVKLLSNAQIIFPTALAKDAPVAEYFKEYWGKITITDASERTFTLYAVSEEVDLDFYEMPPMPHAGSFDIRYSSNRIAEDIGSSIKTIDLTAVEYPIVVRVENMTIRLQDETGKEVNVIVKPGDQVTISNNCIRKLRASTELIPDKYALEQNYPNPFNPSTMIEFSLPEDVSNVKLTVYNMLGEKIAELVNTNLKAGRYSYQFEAGRYATGMYIYELRTDKFVSVKKMILLK